jgi:hypothetical protein
MKETRDDCPHLSWATLWVVFVILLALAASLAPTSKTVEVGFGAGHAFAGCDTCGTGTNGGGDHDPTGPDRP